MSRTEIIKRLNRLYILWMQSRSYSGDKMYDQGYEKAKTDAANELDILIAQLERENES
jgi:hypothetical protein